MFLNHPTHPTSQSLPWQARLHELDLSLAAMGKQAQAQARTQAMEADADGHSHLPDPVLLKVFEFVAGPAKGDR